MRRRTYLGLLVLMGLAALAPAAATHAAKKFTVTSTLHGKQVLPHRIPWVARPSGFASEVKFVVDGKVRWIEHKAPFVYSDDGGYLVTSWLSPGRHRFTVKATSSTGVKASETVVARVVAAPEPPADLAGTWQRNVPSEVPADPACAPDPVPAGVYTMTFERRWIETVNPGKFDPVLSQQTFAGYIIDSDWIPGQKTFEVAGSVTVNLIRDEDPRGGWWCHPWGPKATYSWSVVGDVLTLAPVGSDPIHQRAGVFTGTWRRVH